MDYLQLSELYHTQAKGAKWGVLRWTREQGKSTLNDAGFLRQYGHPRGVPKGTKLHAVRPEEFDDFIKDLSERNKEEEPNYAKMFAEAKAKKNYEDFIKEQNDPNKKDWDDRNEYIKKSKINEEYEKYLKKYDPTEKKIQQVNDALASLPKAAEAFAKMLPDDGGTKVYGRYDNLSTEELNNRILRISKERTYSDMIGDTKVIKSGKAKARETIQTIGAISGLLAPIVIPIITQAMRKKAGG